MCGIAGIVEGRTVASGDPAVLRRMCRVLHHRGPDALGEWSHDGVLLGHRRLSIIDLDRGQQPMTSRDGSIVVAFNGEIYNYCELRSELVDLGYAFDTRSDTEVLVAAWHAWGADALPRLRGMFAIAVWERFVGRLTLVRDRIGIKPLYWAHVRDAVVFGSELKAVMASGRVAGDVDPQAVDDFFAHGWIAAPRTIFAEARKLGPGRCLVVERDVGTHELRVAERVWWSLPSPDRLSSASFGYEDAKERLEHTLFAAVRAHLVADVPLGAFLSGGLDSTAVVWMMSEALARPVHTFSIGFDEPAFDETSHARKVAERLGAQHTELRIGDESLALLPDLLATMDEPFGDPSIVPTWYVSRLARADVTVALSGDGGDEVFAGYSRYPYLERELARLRSLPGTIRAFTALAGGVLPLESRGRNRLERAGLSPERHYERFRAIFSEGMRRALFAPELARAISMSATGRRFAELPCGLRDADPVTRLQAVDMMSYLPDDVLTKVDRMSMAHSLEVRVPLLDHHVVELAATLPVEFKLSRGSTKRILRDIMARAVPPSLTSRPKQGFALPLAKWLRGELGTLMDAAIASETYREGGSFQPAYLQRLWRRHRGGAQDLSWSLWQVLVFQIWNERVRPTLVQHAPR